MSTNTSMRVGTRQVPSCFLKCSTTLREMSVWALESSGLAHVSLVSSGCGRTFYAS
jgi:hypothetical protein